MTKFDPVAVWLGIFNRAEFESTKMEELVALANKLADLGLQPQHDMLMQTYRSMGYETECDFWEAHQPGLPFEKKAAGSLRVLEQITGHSRNRLSVRRLRVMGSLSQARDNSKGKKNVR